MDTKYSTVRISRATAYRLRVLSTTLNISASECLEMLVPELDGDYPDRDSSEKFTMDKAAVARCEKIVGNQMYGKLKGV